MNIVKLILCLITGIVGLTAHAAAKPNSCEGQFAKLEFFEPVGGQKGFAQIYIATFRYHFGEGVLRCSAYQNENISCYGHFSYSTASEEAGIKVLIEDDNALVEGVYAGEAFEETLPCVLVN